MEQIAVFFSDAWVPKTWLSPIVNIWERNGTKRITNGICQEIAGWFYIYNFNEYSPEKNYLYLFDGTSTLSDSDRYIAGNNDLDSYSNKATWGRTVAANIDYKPHFKALEQKLTTIPQVDLTGIMSEIAAIKKTLTAPKKKDNSDLKALLSRIEDLESSLVWTLWVTKEEVKWHVTETTWISLEDTVKKIVTEYQKHSKLSSDALSGLSLEIKEKLDTLTSKDDLSTTSEQIHEKLEEIIHWIVTNYMKENFMSMFDLSVKRKNKEIPVKSDEDILLDILK